MLSLLTSGCASPQVDYLTVPTAPSYLKKSPLAKPKCKRVTVRDLAVCERKKDAHINYLQSKSKAQARYIRRLEKVKNWQLALDIYSAAIGTFGGISVALITTFGPTLVDRLKKRKERTYRATIPKIHDVYMHLNNVVSKLGSSRAMIMYTENGGGQPTVGAQLYVSIVYEVVHFTHSIRNAFQRIRLDENYIRMLKYMQEDPDGRTIVMTDQMPDCLLKKIYLEAGTEMAILYRVQETKKRLFYASFNFPHNNLSSNLIYHCDLEAAAIRNLFKSVD